MGFEFTHIDDNNGIKNGASINSFVESKFDSVALLLVSLNASS